nr:MAG TPA: hypothetical protein [Podoviridae sp. ctgx11]
MFFITICFIFRFVLHPRSAPVCEDRCASIFLVGDSRLCECSCP